MRNQMMASGLIRGGVCYTALHEALFVTRTVMTTTRLLVSAIATKCLAFFSFLRSTHSRRWSD